MTHLSRFFSLLVTLTACTAFEGVEPGGAPSGGASEGGETGEGGGPAETCLARSPSCLLPELEAVRLCARVGACDTLATAIVRATGVPLAEIDSAGVRIGFNFSSCVDWLTGPLELAHPGFAAVQGELNCLIATSSCEAAATCLDAPLLPSDAASCDEAVCAVFGLVCGDAGCVAGGEPPLCDVPFAQACSGDAVTSCALERADDMWLDAHIDCAEAGLACTLEGVQARCAGEGGCSPAGGAINVCDADSIHLCLQGQEVDFDCASVGLSCAQADLPSGISGRCQ